MNSMHLTRMYGISSPSLQSEYSLYIDIPRERLFHVWGRAVFRAIWQEEWSEVESLSEDHAKNMQGGWVAFIEVFCCKLTTQVVFTYWEPGWTFTAICHRIMRPIWHPTIWFLIHSKTKNNCVLWCTTLYTITIWFQIWNQHVMTDTLSKSITPKKNVANNLHISTKLTPLCSLSSPWCDINFILLATLLAK